jgi:diaminopropionate ammonia-lyase
MVADLAGSTALASVRRFLDAHELAAPTPLRVLPHLAAELGVGAVAVKDESARMGLTSFKALGGPYAVAELAREAADERGDGAGLTFVCATDGNHGRAVAFGARLAGARAVVFVHPRVEKTRREAIANEGAQVVEAPGVFEDALDAAEAAAHENGWILVSDTARPGYERIPALIMRGYAHLAAEALEQSARPPTHVFVQAGVGGLAAAVTAVVRSRRGLAARVIVVEPQRAACLLESARAGRPIRVTASESTSMSLLECYEPSHTAWRLLASAADVFVAVDEEVAEAASSRLEHPLSGDPILETSESGAAGLAGLCAVLGSASLRERLGLDALSRVLLINSERRADTTRDA